MDERACGGCGGDRGYGCCGVEVKGQGRNFCLHPCVLRRVDESTLYWLLELPMSVAEPLVPLNSTVTFTEAPFAMD